MANTHNRSPISFPISSTDYKHLNHNNWKGVSDNDNALSVDQLTFEDAKNVYIDEVGILKSRPSIKRHSTNITDLDNSKIKKVWKFESVTVYLAELFKIKKLYFTTQTEGFESLPIDSENVHLIMASGNIYVFTPTKLYKCTTKLVISEAKDDIYYPTLYRYVDGILTDSSEEPNELSTSYKEEYIFTTIHSGSYDNLVDEKVTIILNDEKFDVTFGKYQQLLFADNTVKLPTNVLITNEDTHITLASTEYSHHTVSVSDVGSMIYSIPDEENLLSIFYSSDGRNFNKIPSISNVLGLPKISKDGTYVACFTENGLYFYSLVASELNTQNQLVKKYETWTNVLDSLNYEHKSYVYYALKSELVDGESRKALYINGDFLSYDIFCFVYSPVSFYEHSKFKVPDRAYSRYGNCKLSYNSVCVCCDSDTFREIVLNGTYVVNGPNSPDLTANFDITDGTNSYTIDTIPVSFNASGLKYTLQSLNYADTYSPIYLSGYFESGDIYEADTDIYYLKYDGTDVLAYINTLQYRINSSKPLENSTIYGNSIPNVSMYLDNSIVRISVLSQYAYNDWLDRFVSESRLHCIVGQDNDITTMCNEDLFRSTMSLSLDCKSTMTRHVVAGTERSFSIEFDSYFEASTLPSEPSKKIVKNVTRYYYDDVQSVSISNDTNILISDKGLIHKNTLINYLHKDYDILPVAMINNTLYALSKYNDVVHLYTTLNFTRASVYKYVEGTYSGLVPTYSAELSNYYIAHENKLYESRYVTDDFKWYFPSNIVEEFDDTINAIHPVSKDELAVFLEDSIYHVTSTNVYKTKIGTGCKFGSSVITTFDGSTILFSSDRGLVAMTYQNFIASNEQTLSYLSDTISKRFSEFNKGTVKLYQYKYWIICYKDDSTIAYVYDIRNQSWWEMDYNEPISDIITLDIPILLSEYKLYHLDTSNNDYKDFNGVINWSILSQKLHFDAINYYKRIISITLSSNSKTNINSNILLKVKNYRNDVDIKDIEVLDYDVNIIRNFVKQLNFSKVQEFQYKLFNDEDLAVQKPLSLNNVSIKYSITGVIR